MTQDLEKRLQKVEDWIKRHEERLEEKLPILTKRLSSPFMATYMSEVEKWVKRALRFKEQMDKLGVKCKVTVEVKERR